MTEEKHDMDVFGELVKHDPGLLTKPIEELAPISFIGQSAVSAYRDIIRRLDSLGMTEEQKAKTLRDGQEAGKMLLAIEARIGELLPTAEEAARLSGQTAGKPRGGSSVLPREFGETVDQRSKKAHTARTIAAASKDGTLDAVIKEAEDNDDIPTKTAVLNHVRAKKAEERAERYKRETEQKQQDWDDQRAAAPFEVSAYIDKMERAMLALPVKPPADGWDDFTMNRAVGYAAIIVKRLSMFLDPSIVQIAEKIIERTGIEEVSNG